MIRNQPHFYPVVLALLLFIVGAGIMTYPTDPVWFSLQWIVGMFTMIISAIIAIILGGQWLSYHSAADFTDRQHARAVTPLTEALKAAGKLTDNQAASVGALYVHEEGIAFDIDGEEWLPYLITPNGLVPFAFCLEYLRRSDSIHCMAIRDTSDGTPRRAWAQAYTSYLVAKKLALPREEGPYPAAWTNGGRLEAAHRLKLEAEVFPRE